MLPPNYKLAIEILELLGAPFRVLDAATQVKLYKQASFSSSFTINPNLTTFSVQFARFLADVAFPKATSWARSLRTAIVKAIIVLAKAPGIAFKDRLLVAMRLAPALESEGDFENQNLICTAMYKLIPFATSSKKRAKFICAFKPVVRYVLKWSMYSNVDKLLIRGLQTSCRRALATAEGFWGRCRGRQSMLCS